MSEGCTTTRSCYTVGWPLGEAQNSSPDPPVDGCSGSSGLAFTATCPHAGHAQECQKASPRRDQRAPLIPLPVIEEPLQRVAMDIVGPLLRSHSGKKYILVICDYVTRYPEAIPITAIDTKTIAEELMKFFSRVGLPQEILTDQSSNFTSTTEGAVPTARHPTSQDQSLPPAD